MASLVYEREIGIDDSNLCSNGGNLSSIICEFTKGGVGQGTLGLVPNPLDSGKLIDTYGVLTCRCFFFH